MSETVNSLLGTSGTPRSFTALGKKWTARLIDQGVQGEWERHLEDAALKPFLRLATSNPKAYAGAVRALAGESAASNYAWGGEISNETVTTPGGFRSLVSLVFGTDEKPLPEKEANALIEKAGPLVTAAMDDVLISSFPDRADAIRAKIAERDAKKTDGSEDLPPDPPV